MYLGRRANLRNYLEVRLSIRRQSRCIPIGAVTKTARSANKAATVKDCFRKTVNGISSINEKTKAVNSFSHIHQKPSPTPNKPRTHLPQTKPTTPPPLTTNNQAPQPVPDQTPSLFAPPPTCANIPINFFTNFPGMNTLYYGDNLKILQDRNYFPDACVDLVYLDPPFNSNRNYNVLFKNESGVEVEAQIDTFENSFALGFFLQGVFLAELGGSFFSDFGKIILI